MEGLFSKVIDKLTEPTQVIMLLVIGGLFYLLLKKEKTVSEMQSCINGLIKENIGATTRLIVLIEGMVYGRSTDTHK